MTWHPADALEQSEANSNTPSSSKPAGQSTCQAGPGLRLA
ncbi:MAG: hypothetical protein CMM00_01935 [Rhodopirellula sp.]|nr:hypothetical protein [Rhodopirellula sp.]